MSQINTTALITAGNQGGGLEITRNFLNKGVNVAIIADKHKTNDNAWCEGYPRDKIFIVDADFADNEELSKAVASIIDKFTTLDVLINNYSIFNFKNLTHITVKEYQDVMSNISSTFFLSKLCIPYLKHSHNPHIINISPPLFHQQPTQEACQHHLAFSISKYGMSYCTLGLAEELKPLGIAVNSLWQERPIATQTLINNFDNDVVRGSYRAEIYAEAAYLISQKPANNASGQFYIDEQVIQEAGLDPKDFAVDNQSPPVKDIFLPGVNYELLKSALEEK